MPTVKFFWSMTMYDLPGRQLVANPINRYAIGSRSPGSRRTPTGPSISISKARRRERTRKRTGCPHHRMDRSSWCCACTDRKDRLPPEAGKPRNRWQRNRTSRKGVLDMTNANRIGLFSMTAFLAASTCLTTGAVLAQQVPIPQTAADVTAPATGVTMHSGLRQGGRPHGLYLGLAAGQPDQSPRRYHASTRTRPAQRRCCRWPRAARSGC